MIKRICVLCLGLCLQVCLMAQRKIENGIRITATTSFVKAVYRIDAAMDTSRPVMIVEGNDMVLDFEGVILKGSNSKKRPDEFFGVALLIRNSKRVTIRNLKASGYKVALKARNVEQLVLDNCDLGYNYRQHLNSTQEKEDMSDWMSYHRNENDEWLRYGAAIYLKDCDRFVVKNCAVTGGQNALMMMRCNNGKIYNNNFSFNSGIGIGMYRCTGNQVLYNKLNFNVRGYSHGVYKRCQDSAGILLYEQSSNNFVIKNSVTHSGDGLFLWAGQATMDTGQGGCNDNIIADNDFSYAPTNGIEVTFSRNLIYNNRIYECDHGIWGGYSYNTEIINNKFRDNRIAIAIEHGQHNKIVSNVFSKDGEAIRLWARKEQPADWGYARSRDTRSVDYAIVKNSFNNNPIVLHIRQTDSLNIYGNTSFGEELFYNIDSTVSHIDSFDIESYSDVQVPDIGITEPPLLVFKGSAGHAGRKHIRMTEWGPYDFRYPVIWHSNPVDTTGKLNFEILGPKGKWVVKRFKGVRNLSARSGQLPAVLTAERLPGSKTDVDIQLEYRGEGFTGPLGQKTGKGQAFSFSFRKFFQPLKWEVLFYAADTTVFNPIRERGLFAPNVRMRPVKTEQTDRIDYAWWGGLKSTDQMYKQFITIATAPLDIEPGAYELAVTWDDAVRIYLDDQLILDEWNPSKYTFDESPNRIIPLTVKGKQQLRVEHMELGGFATLSIKLKRSTRL